MERKPDELEIVGKTGLLGDLRQHLLSDFDVIVKGEDDVRPSIATQDAVSTGMSSRLVRQPIFSRAARTSRAFLAGQLLTRHGT